MPEAKQALAPWTRYLSVVDQPWVPTYLQLGLLLLLPMVLLGLLCKVQGGTGASTKGKTTERTRPILWAMALLASISLLLFAGLQLRRAGQHGPSTVSRISAPSATVGGTPTFTLPADADLGMNVLPNIHDPEAVDPQAVCPGYRASNVRSTDSGFTADLDLAGPGCHVYGNDVEHLTLSVEFQTDDRLHVEIRPRYVGPQNETWFLLPEALVPRPPHNPQYQSSGSSMYVSWSNDPSFSFSVRRKETGDTLFSTQGKVLVYEDQFIEFGSSLPENYNLYGLGEVIHGFRLGNNLTSTFMHAIPEKPTGC